MKKINFVHSVGLCALLLISAGVRASSVEVLSLWYIGGAWDWVSGAPTSDYDLFGSGTQVNVSDLSNASCSYVYGTGGCQPNTNGGDISPFLAYEGLNSANYSISAYSNWSGKTVSWDPGFEGVFTIKFGNNNCRDCPSAPHASLGDKGPLLLVYVKDWGDGGSYIIPDTITKNGISHVDVAAIPLPAALWMFGSALVLLGLVKRRGQARFS